MNYYELLYIVNPNFEGRNIDDTMKKIDPSEYMQKGWDSSPSGAHPYVRGSLHNKIGMWIMWTYYVLFAGMFIRSLIIVLNR